MDQAALNTIQIGSIVLILAVVVISVLTLVIRAVQDFKLVLSQFKNGGKRVQEFAKYATEQGYNISQDIPQTANQGYFINGFNSNALTGKLPQSNETFLYFDQREVIRTNHGKNHDTYLRSILKVDVPDVRMHIALNSKLNDNGYSEKNFDGFGAKQKIELEGDFSKYFDVFVPKGVHIEALSILAPNTMQYILDNFADIDIEIINHDVYVYAYRWLTLPEINDLLNKVVRLLEVMRLQNDDVTQRVKFAVPTARVAASIEQPAFLRKKGLVFGSAFAIIILVSMQIVGHIDGAEFLIVLIIILGSVVTLLRFASSATKNMKTKKLASDYKNRNKLVQ